MNVRAGFTIVELAVTLTIMVILITLSIVLLTGNLEKGRDEERKTDVANIILYQDGLYTQNNSSYFPTTSVTSTANIETWYPGIDRNNLRTPGVVAPNYSIVPATNATQTTAGVTPQPTLTTYVYQPITSTGGLCSTTGSCRKFNIYYRSEASNTVQMLTSKNQ